MHGGRLPARMTSSDRDEMRKYSNCKRLHKSLVYLEGFRACCPGDYTVETRSSFGVSTRLFSTFQCG